MRRRRDCATITVRSGRCCWPDARRRPSSSLATFWHHHRRVGLGFIGLLGLPLAAEWGVIAFVLNYIPFIGPLIATVLPTFFAVAQFDASQNAVLMFARLMEWLMHGLRRLDDRAVIMLRHRHIHRIGQCGWLPIISASPGNAGPAPV